MQRMGLVVVMFDICRQHGQCDITWYRVEHHKYLDIGSRHTRTARSSVSGGRGDNRSKKKVIKKIDSML